ncbi:integrase [Bradyrhizobium sp. CCBAU 11445]|uniref:tyrosine-type recombinase/integrase n=1 Tax=Bradyrhizobium sp. CCBAU 11445 TaxID=1630896 RepID=UPI002304F9B3|nr:site-specific integrase [Bradyrhizobium sp. CCBAU 11445]MDA9482952.1 integrase [Bradyrhizobium sp. CCBAU 11445]
MARTVRDASLETRTARSRLKARGKPYYRVLEPGLHLGYRKPLSGTGKWVARHYIGDQKYEVETLASADDFSDADGVEILSFPQAQALARSRMVKRARTAAGKTGPLTVADAIASYIEFLENNRKSGREAQYAADAFILPALGAVEIEALTTDQIRKWHAGLVKAQPRIRTKPGKEQQYREIDVTDPDQVRRRKSTANRILTVLKAALNRVWRDGKVASDGAWRRVEPFEGVEAARVRYLSVDEAKRLLNACETDFRRLVRGALETGARYGELCALKVSDFNKDSGTVQIQRSKSNKGRHIILSEDGVAFFKSVAAGRRGSEPMFAKDGGDEWLRSHQADPMDEANERAKIDPPINFHGLRHTWASHAVMNGIPMLVVAKNLGHSDTRMVEKHYGHLAPSYVADAIRAGAPRFGAVEPGNVVGISG